MNSHHDDVARSVRDLTEALQHFYLKMSLQPVGDEKIQEIKKLEQIFCPKLAKKELPRQPIL